MGPLALRHLSEPSRSSGGRRQADRLADSYGERATKAETCHSWGYVEYRVEGYVEYRVEDYAEGRMEGYVEHRVEGYVERRGDHSG